MIKVLLAIFFSSYFVLHAELSSAEGVFGLEWGMSPDQVREVADISAERVGIGPLNGDSYCARDLPIMLLDELDIRLQFGYTNELNRIFVAYTNIRDGACYSNGDPPLAHYTEDLGWVQRKYAQLKEEVDVNFDLVSCSEPPLRWKDVGMTVRVDAPAGAALWSCQYARGQTIVEVAVRYVGFNSDPVHGGQVFMAEIDAENPTLAAQSRARRRGI